MKKTVCLVLISAFLLSLTGCKATLRESIETQQKIRERTELSLEDCLSEEEGYHYPGVQWGCTGKEFQAATNYTITDVAAYGANGESILETQNLGTLIMGRENDDAQVALNKDGNLYMVSLIFTNEDTEADDLSQSALFEGYQKTLTETFGAPETVEEESTENGITVNYVKNYWYYTTADGMETELQFSGAYTAGETEPSYIVMGFVWVNGDIVDEAE